MSFHIFHAPALHFYLSVCLLLSRCAQVRPVFLLLSDPIFCGPGVGNFTQTYNDLYLYFFFFFNYRLSAAGVFWKEKTHFCLTFQISGNLLFAKRSRAFLDSPSLGVSDRKREDWGQREKCQQLWWLSTDSKASSLTCCWQRQCPVNSLQINCLSSFRNATQSVYTHRPKPGTLQ